MPVSNKDLKLRVDAVSKRLDALEVVVGGLESAENEAMLKVAARVTALENQIQTQVSTVPQQEQLDQMASRVDLLVDRIGQRSARLLEEADRIVTPTQGVEDEPVDEVPAENITPGVGDQPEDTGEFGVPDPNLTA